LRQFIALLCRGSRCFQHILPALFHGRRDRVEGDFTLVIWENKTIPILGGREQTGMPNIYADIEDLHIFQQNCFTNASYEGNIFLHLQMTVPRPVEGQQLAQMKALAAEMKPFGWRYIPKVGGPGAELNQPILYPQGFSFTAPGWAVAQFIGRNRSTSRTHPNGLLSRPWPSCP
jgi:acetoacetate decarboxylase